MTPNDIYKMTPQETTPNVNILIGCYYNHIPEVADNEWQLDVSRNEKVEIRLVKDFSFDGRRIWRLGSVWYEGKPVMVIQNAGREGDDYRMRYITDPVAYGQMIGYLASLRKPESIRLDGNDTSFVDADKDCGDLTTFYGHSIDFPGRF